MTQAKEFTTIIDFIDHLKSKPSIIGILQYGNRDYVNMELGGDYDVNVIIDPAYESNVSGLHFYINQIPVDCGIINKEDLYEETAPSDFHCVLLDSKILYDATGEISPRIAEIKSLWKLDISRPTEGEIAFDRFIRQHILDKFEHRLYENEVYTRVFLSGNIFYLLESYMKIEGLNPYNFKGALEKMKEEEMETYQLFQAFEKTQDLQEKFTLTQRLTQAVLRKVGGPWKKGEIIFHYADDSQKCTEQEKDYVVDLIFG